MKTYSKIEKILPSLALIVPCGNLSAQNEREAAKTLYPVIIHIIKYHV